MEATNSTGATDDNGAAHPGLAWLLVLTVLLAGVVRHLGALQVAGVLTTAPESGFNFDTDGPWIPSPLPARATAALRRAEVATTDFVAVFFSPGCGTCLERAAGIVAEEPDPRRTVFLVTGRGDSDAMVDIRRMLAPIGAPILGDPEAHDIVKSLDIESTPFAFRVVDGQVVSKAYVRSEADFLAVGAVEPPPANAKNDQLGEKV